jgi:hypothetical protein
MSTQDRLIEALRPGVLQSADKTEELDFYFLGDCPARVLRKSPS